MENQGSTRVRRPSDNDLPSLRQVGLPPRPRAVLEQVLSVASAILEQGLAASLTEAEQQLFKQAEQARSNDQQNRCFEALREIRRGRADVAPRFVIRLEAALATIDKAHASPQFSRVHRDNKDAAGELNLVDEAEFEESLALQEIASKCEIRNSGLLFALGRRMAVLAGSKAFEADELPLGPRRLCECLREAVGCLDLPIEFRIVLYRAFDRACSPELTRLFESLNQVCIEQRVLPHLALSVARGPRNATAPSPAPDKDGPTPRTDREPAREAAPAPPPDTPRRPAASAAAPASMPMPDLSGIPGAAGLANPMTGWPGAAAATAAPADSAQDARDVEMFETMRDLMAGRRQVLGLGPKQAPDQVHSVRTADVQAVLGALQAKTPSTIRAGGKVVPRSVAHLKQDLLGQLRQLAPADKTPQLDDVDNDTIDLVGMLFEHLTRDARPTGPVQDLMARLQVPLLRVALQDKSFFTRRSHPARQLLNSIAEAGLFWLEDEGADRPLVDKMRLVVDRVSTDFDGDLAVFEELLTDLGKHLGTLARKSEVAERRHVDAAKGRERLDLARGAATRAISERIADRSPPPLLRILLEQAWTDVLALTILRQGEHSAAYAKRLETAERLLDAFDGDSPAIIEDAGGALRSDIESGLSQVGYHGEDIGAVVGRIFGGQAAATSDADAAKVTELAAKLKARSRLGADAEAQPEEPAKAVDTRPLNAEEQRVLDRLRSVPFGSWFEFTVNQQGEKVRRRLSWFSTLTGRCLFVNQRGVRAEDRTLEQLAREIARGQASVVEAHKDSLIDRAWSAIRNTLKGFAGGAPEAAPVPA